MLPFGLSLSKPFTAVFGLAEGKGSPSTSSGRTGGIRLNLWRRGALDSRGREQWRQAIRPFQLPIRRRQQILPDLDLDIEPARTEGVQGHRIVDAVHRIRLVVADDETAAFPEQPQHGPGEARISVGMEYA